MDQRREYRAILAADIERSAGRGDGALREIREVLAAALRQSAELSGIDFGACLRHDSGDGIWLILPAGTVKTRLIHPLAHELAVRLHAHNRLAGPLAQVRVRLALHAGDIRFDPDGAAFGRPLEVVARLLDAPPVKSALAASPPSVSLAVVVSPHFYEETIPHGDPGIVPENFRRVSLTVKEFASDAWLYLPQGGPASPATPGDTAPSDNGTSQPDGTGDDEPDERAPARSLMVNKASQSGTVYAVQHGSQHIDINGKP